MRAYWRQVLVRARNDTATLLGWGDLRTFLVRKLIAALVLVILVVLGFLDNPLAEVVFWLVTGAVVLAAFVVVFVATPHRLAEEARAEFDARLSALSQENARLNSDLEQRRATQDSISRLEQRYDAGDALLERPPDVAPPAWRQEVIVWFEGTEALIDSDFPAEAFMFRTIADKPDPNTPFDICGDMLRARLVKLRTMIGRLSASSRHPNG